MIDILNSYLVQHKSLSIPGLGTIHIEKYPAHMAADSRQLLSPAFVYRFDKFHDTPVKDLFLFVADRKRIPEYEAIRLYNEFAAEFGSYIRRKDEAVWKNVGIFRKDDSGGIVFEPLSRPFALFAPIDADKLISKALAVSAASTKEEAEVLGDIAEYRQSHETTDGGNTKSWWIYALVLFVITAAFLWIHFYNKGVIWQAFFNQQPAY